MGIVRPYCKGFAEVFYKVYQIIKTHACITKPLTKIRVCFLLNTLLNRVTDSKLFTCTFTTNKLIPTLGNFNINIVSITNI